MAFGNLCRCVCCPQPAPPETDLKYDTVIDMQKENQEVNIEEEKSLAFNT